MRDKGRQERRGQWQRSGGGKVEDATLLALKQEESQVKGSHDAFLEGGQGKGTNSPLEPQEESTTPDTSTRVAMLAIRLCQRETVKCLL